MALRWLLRLGALAGIVVVLIPALRQGWTHVETDFPNYYTAAVLARRHAPLRNFYDWTWFQRQMNYAGTERQLGGYTPQPPLAMVPMLPLTSLPPQSAKRVWLSLSVVFLAAALWILSKLTRLPLSGLVLLAMLGYNSLAGNFQLGQWYVLLLLLFALSFWLLLRGRDVAAGALLGAIVLMKLYAAPFVLYFAWKRRWQALAGMAAAGGLLALASIAWFGWQDNLYYVTHVFARAAAGEGADPYAAGLPTLSNLLRHCLMREPELNPHPLVDVPALFFFLQPLATYGVLVFCLIALPRKADHREPRDLAWFLIALLLISFHRAFYVGVVFLAPIALLLENAKRLRAAWLIATYLLLTISLPSAWTRFFPVTWVLLALYIGVGIPYWRNLSPRVAGVAALVVVFAAGFSAYRRMASFRVEPAQKFERVAVKPRAIYSASPAVSSRGIVYESIGDARYELEQWNADSTLTTFPFEGHALHPSVSASGDVIYFELVARGHSRLMAYDPESKSLQALVSEGFDPTRPSISPDQRALAFIAGDRILLYSSGALGAIDTPTPVHDVAWIPGSQRLVFSAGPTGRSQIYATAPPAAPVQITRDSGDHTEPAVSPDAHWLAYTRERWGTRQIVVQDMSSGKTSQLTDGACNSYSPAWTPDSRALVFASDCQRGVGLPALYQWTHTGRFPQASTRN
jgi:hypothetical protein